MRLWSSRRHARRRRMDAHMSRARVQASGAKSTTRAETIRQRLADDILRGVYPPGARLDESGLAKRFNLSRTPVREALRQLTSAGLVEVRPPRRCTVPGATG